MTTIKATCPVCGDIDLTASAVTVTTAAELGWATYSFTCPTCLDPVEKPADQATVDLLQSAGVQVVALAVPAEALEFRCGPAISYDDVLDAVLMLEHTDDIVGALQSSGRALG